MRGEKEREGRGGSRVRARSDEEGARAESCKEFERARARRRAEGLLERVGALHSKPSLITTSHPLLGRHGSRSPRPVAREERRREEERRRKEERRREEERSKGRPLKDREEQHHVRGARGKGHHKEERGVDVKGERNKDYHEKEDRGKGKGFVGERNRGDFKTYKFKKEENGNRKSLTKRSSWKEDETKPKRLKMEESLKARRDSREIIDVARGEEVQSRKSRGEEGAQSRGPRGEEGPGSRGSRGEESESREEAWFQGPVFRGAEGEEEVESEELSRIQIEIRREVAAPRQGQVSRC